MDIAFERRTDETSVIRTARVKNAPGELVVIPAKLLITLAEELTRKTRLREISWTREKFDREHYFFQPGLSRIALRFHPSRADADAIEFLIMTHGGEVIGSVYSDEEDKDRYETMSELLFAIQLIENRDGIQGIADEILHLLPDSKRMQWSK